MAGPKCSPVEFEKEESDRAIWSVSSKRFFAGVIWSDRCAGPQSARLRHDREGALSQSASLEDLLLLIGAFVSVLGEYWVRTGKTVGRTGSVLTDNR
ncbi:hypothetical protein CEXT_18381 [Caerostris extrusa]|uniref:Uncharacterized protein n=1 Tax=Caerostris extrusa TaxID=172846 RepID=A0AAV4Y2B8_CAEEX|nr:hypothetical protein CEXT_18381 [Caerostris extrusa]